MQDYNSAHAYIATLTGYDPELIICDFRMIHDTDKGVFGVNLRGTLSQVWANICTYNDQGYGAFFITQQSDGNGVELPNIVAERVHFIDIDDAATAVQTYQTAAAWTPQPSLAVNSSPGKYHIYWPCEPYADQARFSQVQRQLYTLFGSDRRVIDAARVMRLPGTLHRKSEPFLVTCHALAGYGQRTSLLSLEAALAHVQVGDGGLGSRQPLGSPALAAPSIEWALSALHFVDPNQLDRAEWITVTSAFKQSTASIMSADEAFNAWSAWCGQYHANDVAENWKQWNSIKSTEVGWMNLARRSPGIMGALRLGPSRAAPPVANGNSTPPIPTSQPEPSPAQPAPLPVPRTGVDTSGEILDAAQCREWFNGCTFIERFGTIMVGTKRQMNSTQFNGRYGGKLFVVTSDGKTSNDPYTAAIKSTIYQIPKVDHIRFVPQSAPFEIITDELGRTGINTYTPAVIVSRQGDVTQFLKHMELILPDPQDREIYLTYLAHNVKFPGFKIPWAPLLQSEEGAGKGVIKRVMLHAMAAPYVHEPNAQELQESGSKFNKWMREKLMIIVDEIKVDDRRDMIEVLKPMISEARIEIQAKGVDQDVEDNYSNWIFFSNYKDAIPIRSNGRRFAIFYSSIQSVRDLIKRGMNQAYFDHLYHWLDVAGGKEIVTDWLLRHPVERGRIPMRAPETSSTREALEQSRGPLDTLLIELIEDNKPGFRHGWVSSLALKNAARNAGISIRSDTILGKVIVSAGYHKIGRAAREYVIEGMGARSTLYHSQDDASIEWYGKQQGYE